MAAARGCSRSPTTTPLRLDGSLVPYHSPAFLPKGSWGLSGSRISFMGLRRASGCFCRMRSTTEPGQPLSTCLPMRFAICNETFQDWPFDKAFRFAAELGYTGLEIAPFTINLNAFDITPARRAEVRKQADDAELEIIGLHWLLAKTAGYYLTTPDDMVRHKTTDYIAELARLCRDLGGHLMVLGSPQQRNLLPGVTHEQAMELAADCLRRAMPTL